jgi:hypothetical protein
MCESHFGRLLHESNFSVYIIFMQKGNASSDPSIDVTLLHRTHPCLIVVRRSLVCGDEMGNITSFAGFTWSYATEQGLGDMAFSLYVWNILDYLSYHKRLTVLRGHHY